MKTLDDIALSETDRQAIEQAASIIRGLLPVERIVLFGSKARGDADAESDIDLLVLTRGSVSAADEERMRDALFDLQLQREVVFSELVLSREEWEEGVCQVLPIRHEIDRDGVAA